MQDNEDDLECDILNLLFNEQCHFNEMHVNNSENNKVKNSDISTFGTNYKKSTVTLYKGPNFQVNLLIIFLLKAYKNLKDWKLSTENKKAGKFDDVVLEWPDQAVLLQAKHKKQKIAFSELFSTNTAAESFSLPKYFWSYHLDVKKEFPVKNVVVCTNASLSVDNQTFLKSQSVGCENLLHCEGYEFTFYTFTDAIIPKLKEHIQSYFLTFLEGKNVDEGMITDENIKDFLQHFQFFYNFVNNTDIIRVIEHLLLYVNNSEVQFKIFYQDIFMKVMEWVENSKGEYLNESRAIGIFHEIRSEKYCKMLTEHKILFECNDLDFGNMKNTVQIVTKGGYLLEIIKIYGALCNSKTKMLFVNPDDDVDVQKQVVDAFELPCFTFLIMVCFKIREGAVIKEVSTKLKKILEKYQNKRVILVAEENDKLVRAIAQNNDNFEAISGHVTFSDLSKDTQRMLLRKTVIFQGSKISLKDLFGTELTIDYEKAFSSEILERLIRNEEVRVGSVVRPLDEDIQHYYVHRQFKRKMKEETDEANWIASAREATFSEEDMFKVDEKFILVADIAGMGKTTVFSKLAVTTKENNPHLWIINIELNNYTRVLRDFQRKGRRTIDILQLLGSKDYTKLKNDLEVFLFSLKERVVLFLDGMDQIDQFTDLILSLITACQTASNFLKIFISTRPNMAKKLQQISQSNPFILQAFTEVNQIDFLTNYWIHNLNLSEANEYRCRQYAQHLIRKTLIWTNSPHCGRKHFAAIPLQANMLGEIFQENYKCVESCLWLSCKEYLDTDEEYPKLPEKMNMTELYELFIKKKQDVFLDKENPSGGTAANEALVCKFNECLASHQILALHEMFSKTTCELFSCYRQPDEYVSSYMLKIGIVQKWEAEEFHFIHRTFAEYFVSKCLITELQNRNDKVEFQKFLIDGVLCFDELEVVRRFLDDSLKQVLDTLPRNMFQEYQSLRDIEGNQDLIHLQAKEGNVSIIQLLIGSFADTIKIMERTISRDDEDYILGNTLKELEALMSVGGFNIRDRYGFTPLLYAIERDHLEMVQYLIDRGANANRKDPFGSTVLHYTALNSYCDMPFVEYLVDNGANVNSRNYADQTALHLAALLDNRNVLKVLLKRGCEVNLGDTYGNTALHYATSRNELSSAQLIVEHGADVNIKNSMGYTALHSAAANCSFDMVKFLVECGADVNVEGDRNLAPIHFAKAGEQLCHLIPSLARPELDRLMVVKFLVAHGANISENRNVDLAEHLAEFKELWDAEAELLGKCKPTDNSSNVDEWLSHIISGKISIRELKLLGVFDDHFLL